MTRYKGFTLIELMIVIVLLGIVAAIAVPNFTDFIRKNEVQAKADELTQLLQYARSHAVSSRALVKVKQDNSANKWAVFIQDTETRVLEYNPAKTVFDSNIAGNEITFNLYGAVTSPVSISICHKKDHKNGYKLDIKRSGGIKLLSRGSAPQDCKI